MKKDYVEIGKMSVKQLRQLEKLTDIKNVELFNDDIETDDDLDSFTCGDIGVSCWFSFVDNNDKEWKIAIRFNCTTLPGAIKFCSESLSAKKYVIGSIKEDVGYYLHEWQKLYEKEAEKMTDMQLITHPDKHIRDLHKEKKNEKNCH